MGSHVRAGPLALRSKFRQHHWLAIQVHRQRTPVKAMLHAARRAWRSRSFFWMPSISRGVGRCAHNKSPFHCFSRQSVFSGLLYNLVKFLEQLFAFISLVQHFFWSFCPTTPLSSRYRNAGCSHHPRTVAGVPSSQNFFAVLTKRLSKIPCCGQGPFREVRSFDRMA